MTYLEFKEWLESHGVKDETIISYIDFRSYGDSLPKIEIYVKKDGDYLIIEG